MSSGPSNVSLCRSHMGKLSEVCVPYCKCRFLGPTPYSSHWGPEICILMACSMTLGQMVPWLHRPCFSLGSPSVLMLWSGLPAALLSLASWLILFLPPCRGMDIHSGVSLNYTIQVQSNRVCREEQKPLLWGWAVRGAWLHEGPAMQAHLVSFTEL